MICLQECCFHQSMSVRDGSMVLMLPLTHGSGNVAKTYPSLSDIPQLLDPKGRCKLCLLSRHLQCGLFFGYKFAFFFFPPSDCLAGRLSHSFYYQEGCKSCHSLQILPKAAGHSLSNYFLYSMHRSFSGWALQIFCSNFVSTLSAGVFQESKGRILFFQEYVKKIVNYVFFHSCN